MKNAFGDESYKVYQAYPNLAHLTKPSHPIITPRGNEVIERNKFKENQHLLDKIHLEKKNPVT